MSRAIERLRDEHQVLGFALDILARFDRELRLGMAVDTEDIATLLRVLRTYADDCHQAKEERLLFPLLRETLDGKSRGSLEATLAEHEVGRLWVERMEAALRPTLQVGPFSAAAQAYAGLLRGYIRREETELFPLAERVLAGPRLEALGRGFDSHEADVIAPGWGEQLEGLLERLYCKYPA